MTEQRPPGCREAVGSLPRHRKLVLLPGYGPGAGTAGCTLVVTSPLDCALPADMRLSVAAHTDSRYTGQQRSM